MFRRTIPIRMLTAALTAAIVAPGLAIAQDPTPEAFTERIEVRVINLEAVVYNKDGERVRGLKPEDFRLLVNGEEVPIGYFWGSPSSSRGKPPGPASSCSSTTSSPSRPTRSGS
jgi:hypothetical protein